MSTSLYFDLSIIRNKISSPGNTTLLAINEFPDLPFSGDYCRLHMQIVWAQTRGPDKMSDLLIMLTLLEGIPEIFFKRKRYFFKNNRSMQKVVYKVLQSDS